MQFSAKVLIRHIGRVLWNLGLSTNLLISIAPTSQTIFNFDTQQFDFYTMIESRCEGGLAFEQDEDKMIKTYFETFDAEKFNAASNFSESYAGW